MDGPSGIVAAISKTLGSGFYWEIEGKAERPGWTMKPFIKPRSCEGQEHMEKDDLQLQFTHQLNTKALLEKTAESDAPWFVF